MLHVTLYRLDRRGRLDLRERPFRSLSALALFFARDRGDSWDWAEVADPMPSGRTARYPAESLRAIAAGQRLVFSAVPPIVSPFSHRMHRR
jgi:hypothetical protein